MQKHSPLKKQQKSTCVTRKKTKVAKSLSHHSTKRSIATIPTRSNIHTHNNNSIPFSTSTTPLQQHKQQRSLRRQMSTQPEQPKSSIYNLAVVLKPVGEHKRTMFFLHGLGDQGQSFVDVFQMLRLQGTKVILPNAPRIPVTCNNGYVMPGWYDIASLGDDREFGKKEDVEGINYTVNQLEIAIDHEASLVGGHANIAIGGFSQGSAITQLTAARLKNKIAGVVALSGYALLSNEAEESNNILTKDTPYFIYHGEDDEIVTVEYARQSKKYWESKGLSDVTYTEEPGLGHSLSQKEIISVKKFLTKIGFV